MSLPSYPYDGGPRFVAVSVTGVAITDSSLAVNERGGNGRPGKAWCVLDRAYCHANVGEFSRMVCKGWEDGPPTRVMDWERDGTGWHEVWREKPGKRRPAMWNAEKQARALADELNAWNDEVHSAA